MPDIVVHNAMGEEVLKRLDRRISSQIDRDIFRFSVMGPDPYIFYRFFLIPLRRGINKRSAAMHLTKTGQFLMELAKNSRRTDMFSFLSGFLCHYALDSTTHPYICAKADNRGDLHTAIEHKLDRIELERQGKEPKDIMKLFTRFPRLPEAWAAMEKVYGWKDDYFKKSYRHMKLFHWLAKDQHGILNALLGHWKGLPGVISYRTRVCESMDLGAFDELREESAELAVKLITAAENYRRGRIDEKELGKIIGNRSYLGGDAEG